MARRALFLGDSITQNTGWRIPAEERNCGVGGETAQMIAARAVTEIATGNPKYVHILAGTNGLTSNPAPAVAAIDGMIAQAQARGLTVIVGTIPPWSPTLYPTESTYVVPFNTALTTAVAARGAILADYYSVLLSGGVQNPAFFSDGIHPNAVGYQVMNGVLQPLLPARTLRSYRTENYDITPGMAIGEMHYLGAIPVIVQAFLYAKVPNLGFSAGHIAPINIGGSDSGANASRGISVVVDKNVVACRIGADPYPIGILQIDNGNANAITPANWQIFLRLFA